MKLLLLLFFKNVILKTIDININDLKDNYEIKNVIKNELTKVNLNFNKRYSEFFIYQIEKITTSYPRDYVLSY